MPESDPSSPLITRWNQRRVLPSIPILFGLATLWCLLFLLGRIAFTGVGQYAFMVWNLFLAAVPLFWSQRMMSAGKPLMFWSCALLWLLFFPNAPYVLTDLIHLQRKSNPAIPLWYDVGMLVNFGLVGLIFGLVSLRQAHLAFERRFGEAMAAGMVTLCSFLAGFGIYLGRFLRWNSWDLITRPWQLAADVIDRFIDPFAHPRTWVFTVMFGGTICLLYWTSHALIAQGRAKRIER